LTWETVFPELSPDPLGGQPADYVTAAAHARITAWAVADVHDRLAELAAAGADAHRGAAATAVAELINSAADAVAAVVPVVEAVDHALNRHAHRLADLRAEAATALALALDRTHALAAAELELDGALQELATTERQLAIVRSRPPGPSAEIALLEQCGAAQRDTVRWWQRQVAVRTDALDISRAEHAALAEAERSLITATATELRGLPWSHAPLGTSPSVSSAPAALAVSLFAAAQPWLAAAFAHLATSIAHRLVPIAGLFGSLVEQLTDEFSELTRSIRAVMLLHLLQLYRSLFAGRDGDLGGTYESETHGDWYSQQSGEELPPAVAGNAAVIAALRLTADSTTIAADEFAVVRLDNGGHVVVLPGVTDLSNPDWGLSDEHRSVRDLDQHALPSSTSTGMADNRYAQMVAAGLAEFGVPIGSELMIVGHSFGADTALDLAADPIFNGPSGYAVTHVVAAGYYSDPQLPVVPDATEVLVLENANDTAVNVERVGYHPVGAVDHSIDAWGQFWDGDVFGGIADLAGAGSDVTQFIVEAGPLVPIVGLPPGAPAPSGGLVPNAGVTRPGPSQVVSVFDGGRQGAGHHQQNYIDYLATVDEPALDRFTASVAAAGYGGSGEVFTIDVSVPA
jgi:hypothetical protein